MSQPDPVSVTLRPSGLTFAAPRGSTVLQSARDAGIVLPSACRNGTCRRCICLLVAGSVSYRIEWPGLSGEEKSEGFILPCVASAETTLLIEAPEAVGPIDAT